MRAKPEFLLRQVDEIYVMVCTGREADRLNGLITTNETGAFLWKLLQEDQTENDLVEALLAEYDVGEPQARRDVLCFLNKARAAGMLLE